MIPGRTLAVCPTNLAEKTNDVNVVGGEHTGEKVGCTSCEQSEDVLVCMPCCRCSLLSISCYLSFKAMGPICQRAVQLKNGLYGMGQSGVIFATCSISLAAPVYLPSSPHAWLLESIWCDGSPDNIDLLTKLCEGSQSGIPQLVKGNCISQTCTSAPPMTC